MRQFINSPRPTKLRSPVRASGLRSFVGARQNAGAAKQRKRLAPPAEANAEADELDGKDYKDKLKPNRRTDTAMPKSHGSFTYVYILANSAEPPHYYTGLTCDLSARLAEHNQGLSSHTKRHRPWRIDTALAFSSHDKAAAFEKYLKSGSGRAFAKRHF